MVADKPHLRLLGIHSGYSHCGLPQIKKLHHDLSRCRTMPTVLALAYSSNVTMFRSLHHRGEALPACREVATSLTNWHERFREEYRLSVDLLGTSEKNISSLSELMEAMATCLQGFCPRRSAHFSVIIHEESIQVSSRLSQCVITTFIIA
jgi:hypothetical protein